MLVADTLKDYVRTVMVPLETAQELIAATLTSLEQQGRADLEREGISAEQVVIERYLDLRYVGQSYELTIPFEGESSQAGQQFHLAHERRFGYNDPDERVQVVNVRLKARGVSHLPLLEQQTLSAQPEATPALQRRAVFVGEHGPVACETPIYERVSLEPGTRLEGPAIITQYDTTTIVPPTWTVYIDAPGNLLIKNAQGQPASERTHAW
jgi:N-methylhydantoinase A